jgi:phosphatidylglycerophosphate synthase
LHLDSVPALARVNGSTTPLWLVVHYLPSLVVQGDGPLRLTDVERAALEHVHGCLATSHYMAKVLEGVGVLRDRIAVVEPGVARITPTRKAQHASGLRALVVANLLRPKGVEKLLVCLRARLPADVSLRLAIVGSLIADPEYARACRALVESHEGLARSVVFLGARDHGDVLSEMGRSDALISASTTESYGMALAEARAAALPILALRGGNIGNLVQADAGGAVFDDVDALVTDLLRLASDGGELRRRTALAVAARNARTWEQAAEEFVKAVGDGGRERENGEREREGGEPEKAWPRWTLGHSVAMAALLGAAWAARASWVLAAGGAASLLGFVALGRGRWTVGGTLGPANVITLSRLLLVVVVASTPGAGPAEALGAIAVLALDGLDGRIARRRHEASEFGAKFDMETDALFIAVLCTKLAVVGRLGVWILVPGLLRYAYAVAIGIAETRGEAPRSRFGRYAFALQATSLLVALWPLEPIYSPLAAGATLLTVYSFARSAYWSLGPPRIHSILRSLAPR